MERRDTTSRSSNYGWAELPEELLEMIGNRLETRIDVFRFRAICKSWRSVVPLSRHKSSVSPLLNLPPPISATAFLFPVTVCRLEDESRNIACLIKVIESASGDIKLMHPLSSRTHRIKPSLNSTKSLNVLNLRLVELCKGYQLKFENISSGVLVKKVVLFRESGILAIYDAGKLMFWGFGDDNWRVLGSEETRYDDIVVFNGQFYVVDSFGTIFWVDINSMDLVQYSPQLFGFGHIKNLVVSDGQLFVVDTFSQEMQTPKPIAFERVEIRVYKLDEEWGTWVEVKSLADRVFVLGKEVCFSVSSKDFPGCERNCIYFTDSKVEEKHISEGWKRYIPRVFEFDDRRRMKTVDCVPSHRRLFSPSMNFSCSTSSPDTTV